jgi:hypothetical protein
MTIKVASHSLSGPLSNSNLELLFHPPSCHSTSHPPLRAIAPALTPSPSLWVTRIQPPRTRNTPPLARPTTTLRVIAAIRPTTLPLQTLGEAVVTAVVVTHKGNPATILAIVTIVVSAVPIVPPHTDITVPVMYVSSLPALTQFRLLNLGILAQLSSSPKCAFCKPTPILPLAVTRRAHTQLLWPWKQPPPCRPVWPFG